MAWSTDIYWADPKLVPIKEILKELALATNERMKGANRGVLSISYGVDLDPDDLSLHSSALIAEIIEEEVWDLVEDYVDHTQATGTEFIGKYGIPRWTEATMLEDIETGSSRIYANFSSLADWAAQIYNVINRLKWCWHVTAYSTEEYTKLSAESTWAAVESAWPASYTEKNHYSSYTRSVAVYRSNLKQVYLELVNQKYVNVYTGLVHDADYYGVASDIINTTFNGGRHGFIDGNAYLIDTLSAVTSSFGYFDSRPYFDAFGFDTPEYNTTSGWLIYNMVVLRFDVVGGFEYVN